MTMITPSYLGETIEYSSLHACRSTLEDPTPSLGPCDEDPQATALGTALNGSVLDCLIRRHASASRKRGKEPTGSEHTQDMGPSTRQLLDNFRMNQGLSEFAQELYGKDYRVIDGNQHLTLSVDADMVRAFLASTATEAKRDTDKASPNHIALAACLAPVPAISLLRLDVDPSVSADVKAMLPENLVAFEAKAVAALAVAFAASAVTIHKADVMPQSVFIVTPHHAQRAAVILALRARGLPASGADSPPVPFTFPAPTPGGAALASVTVQVDTVEKFQVCSSSV